MHPSFLRWLNVSAACFCGCNSVDGGVLGYFSGLPVLLWVAEQAPPKSKGEMEAIAALTGLAESRALMEVRQRLGTLGMAKDYGEAVAGAIAPFLTTL